MLGQAKELHPRTFAALRKIQASPSTRYACSGLRSIFREVQAGELAKILYSGLIINVSGFEFGFEFAELNRAALVADNGPPAFFRFVEGDAFVFGGFAARFYLSSVSAIFDVGCGAKIGFAVVEGVVVSVVGEEVGRGF